jgi:cytochrome c oxidase subunit 2
MAQLSAGKPNIIAPKGMGPGFWVVTSILTVINIAVALYFLYGNIDWLLPQASLPVADSTVGVDALFKFMAVFGSAITVYVCGYVVYFAWAFRRLPGEDPSTIGVQIHDAPTLELWWTILPTLLLAVLVYLSIAEWYRLQFPQTAPALTMEVIAHQFNFEYRYPGVSVSTYSPELMHLPVGKQVRILVTSGDVLHSFWVPEFRAKIGAVPGLVQALNLTPTRMGEFDIVCAEFCGVNHSLMQGRLIVEGPDAFERWLAAEKLKKPDTAAAASGTAVAVLPAGDAAAGKTVFEAKCSACHGLGGYNQRIVGPGLGQLTTDKSHPNLVNGKPVTPENIAGIITSGYSGKLGVMPSRAATGVSDKDIANLVAYLTSLK